MTPQAAALIGAAAFVAGATNAGAGGGSFISFPALLAVGVAPIKANATNNTAMWLGGLASASVFRRELGAPPRSLFPMFAVSIAGSVIGALLLLRTSNGFFTQLIPVLLLIATVLFVSGPALTRASQRKKFGRQLGVGSPLGLAAQFGISIYGGFFGAAMGILMLALLGLLGLTDLRRANAFKVLLSVAVNGVAVVPFVIAGAIAWDAAFVASACAIAGGYLGARLVKRLPGEVVRALVTAIACGMTLFFAIRTYALHR